MLCYAHLLRLVEDLGKDSDKEEVITFVSRLCYYLIEAMHLKNLATNQFLKFKN